MKKTITIFLAAVMLFSAFPAFAAPVVISYDFEGLKNDAPAQDTSGWTWISFDQWETQWTTDHFPETDTWVEPAERTDSAGGTALRIYTKDSSAGYAEDKRMVYLCRPRGINLGTSYAEIWYKFDWLTEDNNADHKILMYLDYKQREIFSIDTNGALKTLAGETGITVSPGEWRTYEMCLSRTEGLLFYLDGRILNVKPCNDDGTMWYAQTRLMFLQRLYPDGSGFFKGSGMQLDNFTLTVSDTVYDKRLYGASEYKFTEGADAGSLSFEMMTYNIENEDKPCLMIVNIYNEKGEYQGFESLSAAFAANTPASSPVPITVTSEKWGSGWSAKAYVLNSWVDRKGFFKEIYTYTAETDGD